VGRWKGPLEDMLGDLSVLLSAGGGDVQAWSIQGLMGLMRWLNLGTVADGGMADGIP